MKKWVALFLAALICLSFAACAAPEIAEQEAPVEEASEEEMLIPEEEPEEIPAEETQEEPAPAEPASEEPAEDEVCCVLTISVNPEFNLYVNKNGHVLRLECLNEDAQNAIGSADVTGQPVDDAVTVLLEAIYEYDAALFPEDQPMIKVTVDMRWSFGPIEQAIFRMDEKVMAFAESHQIPIGYMRGSAPASEEISTVISDSIDENGNRVVVEVDGDGVEWKTISSGENNQVLELIRTDPDGTVTHCDMQTNITTETKPDGTISQMQGVIGKG